MAKTYQTNGVTRFANRILGSFIRMGIMPAKMHILTVKGRKTGKLYSTPVSLVMEGDRRYVVSPYGEVSWVKNARVSGEATLTRGSKQETRKLRELPPQEAAPILKAYITAEAITRQYFTVTVDSPVEAFEAEASAHPVFELLAGAG
ncbi:MAG: nitroreductase family deazaflavin-dependent oxidoreductase [Anaerolineaceae bacterium]|nr:nitroreductase family deazaflavin-dependent oxidoreductase [Anaerolineaceae bacterium]